MIPGGGFFSICALNKWLRDSLRRLDSRLILVNTSITAPMTDRCLRLFVIYFDQKRWANLFCGEGGTGLPAPSCPIRFTNGRQQNGAAATFIANLGWRGLEDTRGRVNAAWQRPLLCL